MKSSWKGEFTLNSVREHWNKVAPDYDTHNEEMGSTHFQRFIEAMKYIKLEPGQRILDIFARTGNASRFLLESCLEIDYVGVELSEEMLRVARQKHPCLDFGQASPCSLPFVDAGFDWVLSLETLEHVPEPLKFLIELRRVLRSGGGLVLSTPPATAEWLVRLVDFLDLHHGEGPRCFLSSRVVKEILRQSGFILLMHRGTMLIPAGPEKLRWWGMQWLEDRVQNTFLSELGVRQFYVCQAE